MQVSVQAWSDGGCSATIKAEPSLAMSDALSGTEQILANGCCISILLERAGTGSVHHHLPASLLPAHQASRVSWESCRMDLLRPYPTGIGLSLKIRCSTKGF